MPEPFHIPTYRAYLLRCCTQIGKASRQPVWYFSLESVREGKIYGFSSLEALVEFIHTEIGEIESKEN